MSIRSNALPVGRDLSPELQDILRRNGMQAHIIRQGENYLLAVQGHDSPLLTYHISAQQMRDLADWGTNSANKKAYNTFADLVKKDFYMTSICRETLSMPVMPTVVWPWGFMATGLVLANTADCRGTDNVPL